ncbi:MAG: toxin TcdB middle/N-terminal domain-containing protein, partial [Nanoarchaeota archaeon]
TSDRPDGRLVYEQGNVVNQSRRLAWINVSANGEIVRKYKLSYASLNSENTLTSISTITFYGSDGTSVLNSIKFNYYSSDVGYAKNTTLWKPPVLFSNEYTKDFGVRNADLNNDGLIDFIKGNQGTSEKKVWLNNRTNGWSETSLLALPDYFVDASNYEKGMRFVDFDKDGFVDILQGTDVGAANTRKAWRNNGTAWADVSSSMAPGIDFTDSTGHDYGANFGDINGDGYADIIVAYNDGSETKKVYMNNKGKGWVDVTSSWSLPTIFVNNWEDTGARLVDFNGDGLVDILEASNKGTPIQKAWMNTGSGWADVSATWKPLNYFVTSDKKDNGVRFLDVNGDGLDDMVEDFANTTLTVSSAYINTGHGWVSSSSWKSPEPFTDNGNNIGRRIADVNGDGFGDVLVAYGNGSVDYQHTWVKNSTTAYLLKSITNEYGGVTNITYKDSTQSNNTGGDALSDVGFNLKIVNNVTTYNAMNNSFKMFSLTNYSYLGGKYDYNDNEFRGFSTVNETRPDNTLVSHYFHQDDALKGKEYRTEVFGSDGKIYSKEEKKFSYVLNNSYYKMFVDSVSG